MRRRSTIFAVLAVFSLLAAGLTFLFFDRPGGHNHKWGKAEADMHQIQQALSHMRVDEDRYPASLEELKKEHFPNGVPNNPFTRKPYDYVITGDRFFLVCYGKDDAPGGKEPPEADIVYSDQGRLTP